MTQLQSGYEDRSLTAQIVIKEDPGVEEIVKVFRDRLGGVGAIKCVQFHGPGRYQVTFSSRHHIEKATAGGLKFRDEIYAVDPIVKPWIWLTVLGAPFEMSPHRINERLKEFGTVLEHDFVYPKEWNGWSNGNRRIKFKAKKDVPNLLKVGPYNLTFVYDGVRKQCRRCFGYGHISTECTSKPHCYKCGFEGHIARNCQVEEGELREEQEAEEREIDLEQAIIAADEQQVGLDTEALRKLVQVMNKKEESTPRGKRGRDETRGNTSKETTTPPTKKKEPTKEGKVGEHKLEKSRDPRLESRDRKESERKKKENRERQKCDGERETMRSQSSESEYTEDFLDVYSPEKNSEAEMRRKESCESSEESNETAEEMEEVSEDLKTQVRKKIEEKGGPIPDKTWDFYWEEDNWIREYFQDWYEKNTEEDYKEYLVERYKHGRFRDEMDKQELRVNWAVWLRELYTEIYNTTEELRKGELTVKSSFRRTLGSSDKQ